MTTKANLLAGKYTFSPCSIACGDEVTAMLGGMFLLS